MSEEDVIYPHAISGPLDARQRLEFLAFHLHRHRRQVAEILRHPAFPAADVATHLIRSEMPGIESDGAA